MANAFSGKSWIAMTGWNLARAIPPTPSSIRRTRTSNTAREFLSQISGIQISQEANDLEKLTLFLEAARKLNTAGVLDEILMTMLEVTLRLTRAERGYVFLKDDDGKLRLAAGRNSKERAPARRQNHFPLGARRIVAFELRIFVHRHRQLGWISPAGRALSPTILRTVICIPLRKRQVQATREQQTPAPDAPPK